MLLRFRFQIFLCICVFILGSVPARGYAQETPVFAQDRLFTPEADVVDYTMFDGLLKKHVREGKVDYRAWKKEDMSVFQKYVKDLGECVVADMRSSDQKAFWINAYNALAIYGVLQNLPDNPWRVKFFSIKKVPGFFDVVTYKVAGENLTLDQIRAKKLVERFQDARIHCVLVVPAVSAPAAQSEVIRGEDVEDTIDYLTKLFLSDFRKNNLNGREGILYLSEIFSWYEGDFVTRKGMSIVDFVIPFMSGAARTYLEWNKTLPVKYMPYSWGLNIL
jgi:hypothetical protein